MTLIKPSIVHLLVFFLASISLFVLRLAPLTAWSASVHLAFGRKVFFFLRWKTICEEGQARAPAERKVPTVKWVISISPFSLRW